MSASRAPLSASRRNSASHNPSTKHSSTAFCTVFFAALTLLLATSAWGQAKVLYSFSGPPDGDTPSAGLVRDAAGNLYGATAAGGNTSAEQCENGTNGCGVVFELTNSGGTWTESVIHTFVPGSGDGINPIGNLILDSAGNLYGATQFGGTTCTGFNCGVGTVYELSPAGGGVWTETILYNFQASGDGGFPSGGLVMDSAGNLYGTNSVGGNNAVCGEGCGTIFELTPGSGSTWTEHILYTFQDGADGGEPESGSALVFDKAGNLYGTAAVGGDVTCNPPFGCGVVFELSPAGGSWTERAIHNFEPGKGSAFPNTGLAIDALGNLYGNMLGGANGDGYVYRMSPKTGGTFTFTSVYSLDLTHGGQPEGTLLSAGGSIFGTAFDGGGDNKLCSQGCGGVFRLTPSGSGVTYSFLRFGTASNGANPQGNLIQDPSGNLYGTTTYGGADHAGTVFEIVQ